VAPGWVVIRDTTVVAGKCQAARNEGGEAAAVARFVAKLGEASPERREAVLKLLESIEALLPASTSSLDEAF